MNPILPISLSFLRPLAPGSISSPIPRSSKLDYLNGGSWKLIEEFVEVESGKHADRPQLAAALAACKKHKARLVIAKLDRLSRKAAAAL